MQDSLSNLVDNPSELKNNKIDNDVLIKRFYNTYQLSDNDINKFKLLLRKGVYPYEYMDSFIMYIKTEDFYKDISTDIDKSFDTKNDNRPLEIGKNKKVLGKFKDEIVGKIMTQFCVLRAKTHSFLIDEYTDDDYEKNK